MIDTLAPAPHQNPPTGEVPQELSPQDLFLAATPDQMLPHAGDDSTKEIADLGDRFVIKGPAAVGDPGGPEHPTVTYMKEFPATAEYFGFRLQEDGDYYYLEAPTPDTLNARRAEVPDHIPIHRGNFVAARRKPVGNLVPLRHWQGYWAEGKAPIFVTNTRHLGHDIEDHMLGEAVAVQSIFDRWTGVARETINNEPRKNAPAGDMMDVSTSTMGSHAEFMRKDSKYFAKALADSYRQVMSPLVAGIRAKRDARAQTRASLQLEEFCKQELAKGAPTSEASQTIEVRDYNPTEALRELGLEDLAPHLQEGMRLKTADGELVYISAFGWGDHAGIQVDHVYPEGSPKAGRRSIEEAIFVLRKDQRGHTRYERTTYSQDRRNYVYNDGIQHRSRKLATPDEGREKIRDLVKNPTAHGFEIIDDHALPAAA